MTAKKNKLTPKQAKFVDEYLIDLNATQAAMRAGYSKKNARQQACKMLTNPNIETAIQMRMDARSNRTQVTADRVVQEIARLAFGDVRELYDDNGNIKPVNEWPDDAAAMVAGIETSTVAAGDEEIATVTKVKVWDKSKNLDMLMKHLGEYAADKHDHTSSDGSMTPQRIEIVPVSTESED